MEFFFAFLITGLMLVGIVMLCGIYQVLQDIYKIIYDAGMAIIGDINKKENVNEKKDN